MPVESLASAISHPRIHPIPAFADNYVWAITDAARRCCAVVDPGDAAAVSRWLAEQGLELRAILVTHHHADHCGGIRALARPGIPVFGPRRERIDGVDQPIGEGDEVVLRELSCHFRVLDVPGHTAGHVAYHGRVDGVPVLFCGDVLFSAGCGRLFEGTAEQMHDTLERLGALPGETRVYCAHEYTAGNLRFAAFIEPGNPDIALHAAWVDARRGDGQPTLPSDLDRERRINPFLRTREPAVVAAVSAREGHPHQPGRETFTTLRRLKDTYR